MTHHNNHRRWSLILFLLISSIPVFASNAQTTDGRDVTILVTVDAHSSRTRALADKLEPDDFKVSEDKKPQQILSVKRPSETPVTLAVLLQDDLVSRVNNELKGIKNFIRQLPKDSRVMTGYLTAGSLDVKQDFTADLNRAADSLRIIRGSAASAPYNPYVEVIEAIKRFDTQAGGRRMILLVSDGLDTSRGFRSASPALSIDLDRAIKEAQRRGISVFSIYAPAVGLSSASRLAVSYGQGSLNKLADETGGEAFYSGTDFVSFSPYFKNFNTLLNRQWLITYRSSNTDSDFRRIDVSTEYDLPLHHPTGYKPR